MAVSCQITKNIRRTIPVQLFKIDTVSIQRRAKTGFNSLPIIFC